MRSIFKDKDNLISMSPHSENISKMYKFVSENDIEAMSDRLDDLLDKYEKSAKYMKSNENIFKVLSEGMDNIEFVHKYLSKVDESFLDNLSKVADKELDMRMVIRVNEVLNQMGQTDYRKYMTPFGFFSQESMDTIQNLASRVGDVDKLIMNGTKSIARVDELKSYLQGLSDSSVKNVNKAEKMYDGIVHSHKALQSLDVEVAYSKKVSEVHSDYNPTTNSLQILFPEPKHGRNGQQGKQGLGMAHNEAGSTAGRFMYNGRISGFSYLDTEVYPPILYHKRTNGMGDWNNGVRIGVAIGEDDG